MSVITRRDRIAQIMEEGSILVLYSGSFIHVSEDEYYPFKANRQFFYLTGLTREHMALVMKKLEGKVTTTLYIEEVDPHNVRWTGKMVTREQATAISGIGDVRYIDRLEGDISSYMGADGAQIAYFDTYRHSFNDLPDYNSVKAAEFAAKYPGVTIRNLHPIVAAMRRVKDNEEIDAISRAVDITRKGLEQVMRTLKPNLFEYQVQAEFEYRIFSEGAEGPSFATIAGAGANGTMLHYETNRDLCRDGDLILLDLGAKIDGYCADITRTYPINGKFSDRQRAYYEIVLAANRAVADAAKPGITTRELNEICKGVLTEGMIKLGKIEKPEELSRYYMHGVSHHLGIDVHDADIAVDKTLKAGAVITDEPGLYIDEEGIGIRIEDDLLITEEGCIVLSAAILRDPDEIEAFMCENR